MAKTCAATTGKQRNTNAIFLSTMRFYFSLPFLFLSFWFLSLPKGLFFYFGSLNQAFLQFFSLPLFLSTFFKPLKNEYRKGLVGFSIGMGIFVKTFLIAITLCLLLALIAVEMIIFLFLLFLPILTILLLFFR